MKKTVLVVVFVLALCAGALAETAWEYPISPVTLSNQLGYLTLANQDNKLDAGYRPQDLVDITARCAVKGQLRKVVNEALCDMFDAALSDGYKLYVKSSFRSYDTQKSMYYNRLDKLKKDDGVVAQPGSSDHQTGLGVDILNYEWTKKDGMTAAFGKTAEAVWMANHCYEYGFVLRYPADKQDITRIIYEPWHLRYVGTEVAAYMYENNLCLEEFTAEWQAYIEEYEALGGDYKELVAEMLRPEEIEIVGADEDGDVEIAFKH